MVLRCSTLYISIKDVVYILRRMNDEFLHKILGYQIKYWQELKFCVGESQASWTIIDLSSSSNLIMEDSLLSETSRWTSI